MFSIRVGGVLFEAAPSQPGKGFVVGPDGFTGWYEGAGTRATSVARPVAHGNYDLPVYREGRVVTITGTALASSEFDLVHMGQQFTGLLAGGGVAELVVQDALGSRSVSVRLSGEPKFSPHGSGLEADFQVSFFAADPRKYGERREVDGTVVKLVNRGNFAADPVVYVFGPTSGYSLWFGDKRVTVTQALTAGQFHRLEFESGRLYRDNVLQVGGISRLETWTVPPGGELFMEVTGAPEMRVRVTDTYI